MKRKLLRILLVLTMVAGLMPNAGLFSAVSFAGVTSTGAGTEADPYVYEVSDASQLTEAVNAINADTGGTSFYKISLQNDITSSEIRLRYNTTTIAGNGKTLTFSSRSAFTIASDTGNSKPVLILGVAEKKDQSGSDNSQGGGDNSQGGGDDTEDTVKNTLTIDGNKIAADSETFICVGSSYGGTKPGKLIMNDGVTVTNAVGDNCVGGAVTVGGGGEFEMNGGAIEKCGIDSGSTCFGGGVAVFNGGKFTMNGGCIRDCFLNATHYQTPYVYSYGAGAGVFVTNGAYFKMNGGEIKNNIIKGGEYGAGGGIALLSNNDYSFNITSRVEINGGSIEGNKATFGGGGIAVCGLIPVIDTIGTYTTAAGDATAPGLFINGKEKSPVQIKNNSADGFDNYQSGGGGILLYHLNSEVGAEINNAEITGNCIVNNNTPGGGIESLQVLSSLWGKTFKNDFKVTNTFISGNSASEGAGICLYNATKSGVSKVELSGTSIIENKASVLGGGISMECDDTNSAENTVVTFSDGCYIYDNTASDDSADDFYKYKNTTVNALPTAEKMSDYTTGPAFKGWFHDKTGERYSETNANGYTPVESATDELQLKVVRAPLYTVKFDTNGGSVVNEQKVYEGQKAAKPAEDPAYEGYEFAGWYSDSACKDAYDFDSEVTGDLTLYAKWKKLIIDINVDIDVNVDVSEKNYKGLTFSHLLSSGKNVNKILMISEDQKDTLAKAITDSDFSSLGGTFISIELLCKVREADNEREIEATEKYINENYKGYDKLSYDVGISKIIKVDDKEIRNENIKSLPEGIHVQFSIPDEWTNGTVKILRAHTSGDDVIVEEMPNVSEKEADKQVYEIISDKFSTYTMICKKTSSGGSDGSGDTPKSGDHYFAAKKVDAQDSRALSGAKFGLYLDGKEIAYAESDSNGMMMFKVDESDYLDITDKSDLYYQELTAPEGYVVSSDKISIKKNDLASSQSKAKASARTVKNYRSTTPDMLNGDDHFAYIIGYEDGTVKPNGLISRAETATVFFRLLKDSVRDSNLVTENTYTDVTDDYWANTAVSTMTKLGIVQGKSTSTFDPKAPITRAEFAAICARFDTGTADGTKTFSDISGHWAEKYIQRAAQLGWIKGFEDGTFRPDTYITRAEAMTMIDRVLNRLPEKESDLLSGMRVWPDCSADNWSYLAVQEATNSHDFKQKTGNYETWTATKDDPDWTRYEC